MSKLSPLELNTHPNTVYLGKKKLKWGGDGNVCDQVCVLNDHMKFESDRKLIKKATFDLILQHHGDLKIRT